MFQGHRRIEDAGLQARPADRRRRRTKLDEGLVEVEAGIGLGLAYCTVTWARSANPRLGVQVTAARGTVASAPSESPVLPNPPSTPALLDVAHAQAHVGHAMQGVAGKQVDLRAGGHGRERQGQRPAQRGTGPLGTIHRAAPSAVTLQLDLIFRQEFEKSLNGCGRAIR